MDSGKQANFFNSVADITSNYDTELCFQLQHITDEEVLSDDARELMKLIGEYSEKQSA